MKDEPAFPQLPLLEVQRLTGYAHGKPGLTKREYFAAMAMQADFCPDEDEAPKSAPIWVAAADALIAELEKK